MLEVIKMNVQLVQFDDEMLIKDKGLMTYTLASTVKQMMTNQIIQEMHCSKLTKKSLAKKMGTSRAAINRLLDPDNTSVTLNTLEKVALALSKRLKIEFS